MLKGDRQAMPIQCVRRTALRFQTQLRAPLARPVAFVLLISVAPVGCGSNAPVLPDPPPRVSYLETTTVALEGCVVPSVEVPWAGALQQTADDYVSDAHLCFAIRALKAWADVPPVDEPSLKRGDGERIAAYWREPRPPPHPGELPYRRTDFIVHAEIPGRPRTVWVAVDTSLRNASFGSRHGKHHQLLREE